jgi:hypothetical protein
VVVGGDHVKDSAPKLNSNVKIRYVSNQRKESNMQVAKKEIGTLTIESEGGKM